MAIMIKGDYKVHVFLGFCTPVAFMHCCTKMFIHFGINMTLYNMLFEILILSAKHLPKAYSLHVQKNFRIKN